MSSVKPSGRLPIDQGAAGRQDIWLALKTMPSQITVTALMAATGLHRSTIQRYLRALTAAGHLSHHEAPPGLAAHWVLTNDVGHHAPRLRPDGSRVTQGDITAQLWRAMYMLKDFDFGDLVHNASIEIPEATAKDYCKRLLAAGYLKVLVKADPHRARPARYRLIRHSGPKAPQVQRVRQIYDPNTRAVYPLGGLA